MTIWTPQQLDPSIPKYQALANAIAEAIAQGLLSPGEKLPTHRALADRLNVTVGTVTRAYAEAEKRQLIASKVGSGTFVRRFNESEDFVIGHEQPDSTIDLSFSLTLNQGQAQLLAETLAGLQQNPGLLKRLLEYQTPGGLTHHREAGLRWLELSGISTGDMDRLLLTNGGQHGFHTVTAALCRAGDTVLSAGLTYPGFILSAQQIGVRHIGLDSDDEGILPDALNSACARYKPRVLYMNSRINNPSCETTSLQRMDQLAEIARRHSLWIIDDDILGCLSDPSIPSMAERHPDITVLVTGTSKALTGGLRVGYCLPPKPLERNITTSIRASGWMTPPLMAEIAGQWIEQGTAEKLIANQRLALLERHRLAADRLADQQFYAQPHGLNIWLLLPEPRRAQEFCQSLQRQSVLTKPSTAFAAGHYPAPQAIRFCLGGDTSLAALDRGLSIIKEELRQAGAEFEFTL